MRVRARLVMAAIFAMAVILIVPVILSVNPHVITIVITVKVAMVNVNRVTIPMVPVEPVMVVIAVIP